MRNLEIKARIDDPAAARRVAQGLAAKHLGVEQQVDTYFACRHGRLKLRQIDSLSAELVWYCRPDELGPKPSEYVRVPVADPESLKAALSAALGVVGVVRKRREVFLVENVRIHLDEVDGLGMFLELEAVLDPQGDPQGAERTAQELLGRLLGAFELGSESLVSRSYSELAAGGK